MVETEQIPTHREPVAGGGAARPPGLVWTVAMKNVWARKSIAALRAEAEDREVQALTTHGGIPLKRTLSATSLVALGIGAIVGAGIFVLTGHAAAVNAG